MVAVVNATGDSSLLPAAEPASRRYVEPLHRRVLSRLSAYLPLLLMALLALATWWLVKNTPVFQGNKPVAEPRHIADYQMRGFTVQRFAADGALRVQIEGTELRHFPDTDTLEIDNARIRAINPDGHVTRASAQKALSNGDASELQLSGQAHVVREAYAAADGSGAADAPVDFRGEF